MALDYLIKEAESLSEEQITLLVNIAKLLKIQENKKPAPIDWDEDGTPIYRKAGAYKGKIWMSDDFDEPLEEFKEYM